MSDAAAAACGSNGVNKSKGRPGACSVVQAHTGRRQLEQISPLLPSAPWIRRSAAARQTMQITLTRQKLEYIFPV
eukprot:364428-Chlamydomonas_euryale.AAC.6